MKRILEPICIILCAAILNGCAVTIPIKGAKAGVKTIKTAAAVGAVLIPGSHKKKDSKTKKEPPTRP